MDHFLKEAKPFLRQIRVASVVNVFLKVVSLTLDVLFALVYWPLLAFLISLVYLFRYFLQLSFSRANSKGHKYKFALGSDALYGYKIENGNSLIHSAIIVKGVPDYDAIVSRYENVVFKFKGSSSSTRNKENIYLKLKHVFTKRFGFYCWRDASEEFDIRNHVKWYAEKSNNNNNNNDNSNNGRDDEDTVSETRLMDILAKLSSDDLPDSRPQWEHVIIPKFKFDHESESSAPQHFVCIFRIHHTYADGGSLGIFMDTVLADEPVKFAMNPYKPFPGITTWQNIFSYANMIVKGPADFVRTLKSGLTENSKFFVKSYSPKKVVAWSEPIDMDILRGIKKRTGASVPSILLSSITAALKYHHMKHFTPETDTENKGISGNEEAIPKTINIGTISVMLPYETLELQNHFTTFNLNCPFDDSCSVDRLQKTNTACRLSGYSSEPRFNYFVMGLLGDCPIFVQNFFVEIAGTPIIFSNVPGLVEPMKVFGGTLVDTGVFLPSLRAYGIGIATYSYCGKLRICISADSKIFSTSLQAKEFLKFASSELDKLANSYEECVGCKK